MNLTYHNDQVGYVCDAELHPQIRYRATEIHFKPLFLILFIFSFAGLCGR